MSRRSIERRWTADEHDLAELIVYEIEKSKWTIVGARSLVRAVGLPYSPKQINRSLKQVYDVMPLATMLTPSLVPGKALVVGRDHTYRLTDRAALIRLDAVTRLKRSHTMMKRISATLSPLAITSDPTDTLMLRRMERALAELDPAVWDAIVARAELGK